MSRNSKVTLGFVLERGKKEVTRKKISEDDYEKIQVIGKGGFATVFLVVHRKTGKQYAMKKQSKQYVVERGMIEKIMEERRLVSLLEHPNITRLCCSFQSHHHLFLIFEFCNGGDLLNHIDILSDFSDQEPPTYGFKEERARFYAAQIFLSINFLHGKNVIYRDLKPENVLLDSEGNAKLCDLGLAKQIELKRNEKEILTNTITGTELYFAPEMIDKPAPDGSVNLKPYSKDIDWWMYGILLSLMIFGDNPFITMHNEEKRKNDQFLSEAKDNFRNKEGEEGYSSVESSYEEEERIPTDMKLYFHTMFNKKLKLPHYDPTKRQISDEAKDFITQLLSIDPKKRLGYKDENEIKNHPFFTKYGYDEKKWEDLLIEGKVTPPWVPKLRGTLDCQYIDYEFTSTELSEEEVQMKKHSGSIKDPVVRNEILRRCQREFKGYSFACSMSAEMELERGSRRRRKGRMKRRMKKKKKSKVVVQPVKTKKSNLVKKKIIRKNPKNPRNVKLKK